jgi:hypothetical protein
VAPALQSLSFVSTLAIVLTYLLGCSEKLAGDTSFTEAKKDFDKELSPDQRQAAIKQLQTETARDKR